MFLNNARSRNLRFENKGFIFLLMLSALLRLSATAQQSNQAHGLNTEGFKTPSGLSKPLVWWHWISGNVTKDGIRKDLIDLENKGIGGVQQFDVGMYPGSGLVPYGSDSWHDHIQYAIYICDSLGLEFYMMNSPGYSGAGGPWVPVEKSMKYVVWGEWDIKGGQQVVTKLASPHARKGFYEDIAIIAVPKGQQSIDNNFSGVYTPMNIKDIKNVYDENYQTSVAYPVKNKEEQSYIQFDFKNPIRINLLNIDIANASGKLELLGSIETTYDGKSYKKLKEFKYDGHRALDGNFSVLFAPTLAKSVRIAFEGTSAGNSTSIDIREIKFRYLNQATNLESKTGAAQFTFANIHHTGGSSEAIALDKVIDITKFYDRKTNEVKWKAPSGEWTILRIGYTTTGKQVHPAPRDGLGYEIDKLDPEAVAFQFEHSLGRIIKEARGAAGKTFKGILFDSFEGGFQNWTPSLPSLFKDRKQYDILFYLPVLAGRTIMSDEVSAGFLWDFRDVVNKLFGVNYFGTMQKLAHQHNLLVYAEAQGGQLDPAIGNTYTDIPMNEFWTDPGNVDRRRNNIRHTVSIASVLGRNIVAAEAFTSRPEYGKWQNTPFSLKKNGDYAFTTGLNRFIFHTYTHQPFDIKPGMTMGRWGTHFSRHVTWWEYGKPWVDYLSRSQYLLQKGRIVADICYLFPEDSRYRFPPKIELPPAGYEYDILFPEYLDSMKCLDNTLYLRSGANYKLMVLPDYPYMTVASLKNIDRLLNSGAIIVGVPPKHISNLEGIYTDQLEFNRLVNKIWGNMDGKRIVERQIGKGKIYWGKSIKEVLRSNSIQQDLSIASSDRADSLKYLHKSTDSSDIYFISNQEFKERTYEISFRIHGKTPEIWDAETGEVWDMSVFKNQENRTLLTLKFNPYGSLFVVFRKNLPKKWVIAVTNSSNDVIDNSYLQDQLITNKTGDINLKYNDGTNRVLSIENITNSLNISSTWALSFLDGMGAPELTKIDELISWPDFNESAIRHYSGSASYKNSFVVPSSFNKEKERCLLDLGEIYDVAAVKINNKDAGVIWRKPAIIDVSDYLLKGKNTIEVIVVNRWSNRLIGDEAIPTAIEYDKLGKLVDFPEWYLNPAVERKDQRFTFTTWRHYDKDTPLKKSGLIGPVNLSFYQKIDLKK